MTANFDRIVIEDLAVKNMMRNPELVRAISNTGFGYPGQMIEYKATLRNCDVVIADRFFPSGKTCSACDEKKDDLSLKDRIFVCDT